RIRTSSDRATHLRPLGRRARDHLFHESPDLVRVLHDPRDLPPVESVSTARFDRLTGEWVGIAAHRQTRIYHPPTDQCPLCPSTAVNQSEIPSAQYDVVVFENRFPSFSGSGVPAV